MARRGVSRLLQIEKERVHEVKGGECHGWKVDANGRYNVKITEIMKWTDLHSLISYLGVSWLM